MRRVNYDYLGWAETLQQEGVDPVFIEPLCTAIWTTGISSLLEVEREQAGALFSYGVISIMRLVHIAAQISGDR